MEVKLRLAPLDEKPAIAALLTRYLAELGPWGYGDPNYPFLDSYWRDERRRPYVIEADGQIAGFVFVDAISISGYAVDATIAEFFVAREFRRRGCGAQAAASAFRARRGQWELSFHRDNTAARRFWFDIVERNGGSSMEFFDVGKSRIMRFRVK